MNRIFFCKISSVYSQQFVDNFYAGGKSDSSWYNGLQAGDYVFPIYNASVSKLWKVKEFSVQPNPINQEGSVLFDIVKEFPVPVPISSTFTRYKYFELDLTLLNKSVKSTAKEGKSFFPITLSQSCPPPEVIDFSDRRNIFLSIEQPFQKINYKEEDIRILLDGVEPLKILDVQIFKNGVFQQYDILYNLYKEKNLKDQFYGLSELLEYSKSDEANKKENFLKAAIGEIKNNGFFIITSPIALYDNILVGRKKSFSPKKQINIGDKIVEQEDDQDIETEELEEYTEFVDLLNFSPNLILYGPPGTGKTYSIKNIITAFDFHKTKLLKSYEQINGEDRITFITFHQSFSYEEFVEGLRPVLTDDENNQDANDSSKLNYRIQDGILKQISKKAELSQIKASRKTNELDKVNANNAIWKVSLGARNSEDFIYQDCIDTNTIAIGWLNDVDLSGWVYSRIYHALIEQGWNKSENPTNDASSIDNFINEMVIGDVVLIFHSVRTIRAIGIVDGEYFYDESSKNKYPHRRKVQWLRFFDPPLDVLKYNDGVRLTLKTVYPLPRIRFADVKEMLDFGEQEATIEQKNGIPYYLIIDEINRGNISKIFGELITLVEKDKRNKVTTKLPYSQKEFTLPSNLYIIGTMNTADRSIAVLDTALRRRFVFKEIEPDAEIIRKSDNQFIDNDLDLAILLDKLNAKISLKLDRDHRLGHSYFLQAYSLESLRIIWYYQVIPLFMEYFYNAGDIIESIITESFIDKKTCQIKWISSLTEFKKALLNIS